MSTPEFFRSTLVASALRSQLGPLGQNEFVFDTSLRTMDLRTMRPAADIYCAQGAMALMQMGEMVPWNVLLPNEGIEDDV